MNLTCPYCEETFSFNGYTAHQDMATHKSRCPQKRYLGGELEIETALTAEDLLDLD